VRWIGFSEKCQSASGSALIDLQDGKLAFPQTVQDSSMASTLTLTRTSVQFDGTDGHRSGPGDPERGKRFVKRADEKLTAFMELETAIRLTSAELELVTKPLLATQFAPQGSQAKESATEQRNCSAAIGNASRSDLERKVLVW
jgi:hypothetical protein